MTIPTGLKVTTSDPMIYGGHATERLKGSAVYWPPNTVNGIRRSRFQGTRQWIDPNQGEKVSYKDTFSLSKLQRLYCEAVPLLVPHYRGPIYDWGDSLGYCQVEGFLAKGTNRHAIVTAMMGNPGGTGEIYRPGGYAQNSNALNRSVLRAYAKLDGTDVETLVTLAESSETVQLLRLKTAFKLMRKPVKASIELFKDIGRSARRYRRLPKHAKTMSLPQAAANVWMEARYGWRPLAYEIAGYRDYIAKGAETHEKKIFRVAAVEKFSHPMKTWVSPKNSKVYVDGKRHYLDFSETTHWSYEDKYATYIFYRTKALSEVHKHRVELGLTIDDIPTLLWEKVPLSFVSDWFLDTGIWLKAWKAKPQVTVLRALTSIKQSCRCVRFEYTGLGGKVIPQFTQSELPLVGYDYLERVAAPTRSALPTVNPHVLNVFKQADSASLLWQRVANLLKPLISTRR